MRCHHNLETYLHEYIDGSGLASDPKALLFQTYSRATGQLTGNPLPQANAYAMIQRDARTADITTKIGNHAFRATGVTAYLENGGTLEKAAQMANHASTRTTQLYDRRAEEVTWRAGGDRSLGSGFGDIARMGPGLGRDLREDDDQPVDRRRSAAQVHRASERCAQRGLH
jgi:hypothetical protein